MDKQVQFFGKTASGIFCQSLFGSAGAFEKVAGAPAFADWETGDSLRKYISTLGKEERKKNAYVLVNALGAGEFFGSNINADFFPWNALAHEGDDYGHKTFLKAHAFQHHANKDPTRAFGVPTLSLLNTPMKRVELIIKLDREKAKHEGADGIIVRIDKGEFPDVSMGCKVPYDVCSICHARSKTRADYCQHMMPPAEMRQVYGPNKILEDGRKVYVVNLHPRFFDISFVFIGADKTAKVMAKLASRGSQVCFGDICALPRSSAEVAELDHRLDSPVPSRLEKTASKPGCSCGCGSCGDEDKLASAFSVKTSSKKKLGEILKEVPTGVFASKSLPSLEGSEPEIPTAVLDALAGELDVGSCCSTAGMMGMVLRPREFQRIILIKMGEQELADDFDVRDQVFRQVRGFDDSIPYGRELFSRKVASALQNLVPDRSVFGESFRVRLAKTASVKNLLPTQTRIEHPLLDKISAAYNGYRRNQLLKLSQAVEVVQSDPKLREEVLGTNLVNMFMKTSSAAPVVSLDSIGFLMGAHFTDDRGLLSNTAVAGAAAVVNKGLFLEESLYSAQGS
jgi:hypothetical protein